MIKASIQDNSIHILDDLTKKLPNVCKRAIRMTAGHYRKELKKDVSSLNTPSHSWEASLGATKSRRILKKTGDISIRPKKKMPFGQMRKALRYDIKDGGMTADIGYSWNRGLRSFMSALQEGARGSKYRFSFSEEQPVTAKMRRKLWAMKIPISKDTTTIKTPKRPIVEPFLKSKKREIPVRFQRYFERALKKETAKTNKTLLKSLGRIF